MTQTRANLLLLFAGLIWGLGFVAQSTAMENIGPLTFIGLRFIVATAAVLPFALRETARASKPLTSSDYKAFAILGSMLFSGMVLQQTGLLTTSVTNAGFLTGLYVVLVPLLGVLLFSQWPHPVVWVSAVFSLTGIFLLSGGSLDGFSQGDWLMIAGAIFWALQGLFIARYALRIGRPITMACIQFAVVAVAGLAAALTFEQIEWHAIQAAAPEILFTGMFSSGVAFTLQAIGTRYTSAPQAAIFLSSEALFAALFGAILLGERLPVIGLAGCALIFLSMLMVEIVPRLRFNKTKTAFADSSD
ncbi:DMT family transporter [Bacillus subtilis]|uniref:DMT family transporter n=1 Tax=Pseudochrobactrum asaccharolyticum TaxID=354351 RepID=UPI001F22B2FE|nr:DMT family transporter [Pseudochrobactrum asaccharolyticum]MCF7646540.1 DMT family transporter [Pseudochrobactrum asaccharolyticum]MCF7672323.1 DMT family transporter [Bacillus subtilis]